MMHDYNLVSRGNSLREVEYKLNELVQLAYSYAATDPASCMNTTRRIAEVICRYTIEALQLTKSGSSPKELESMRSLLRQHPETMPRICEMHAETIQKWGNFGSHDNSETLSTEEILSALIAMQRLVDWFCLRFELSSIGYPDLSGISALISSTEVPSGMFVAGSRTSDSFLGTVPFFSRIKENPSNIESIGMAFHAGAEWRNESEKFDLIQFIQKNRIPLRIILNDSRTVRNICPHMHQEGKRYVGFNKCIKEWRELQTAHEDFIQVRTSKIPMLHRTYLIQNKDSTGSLNVKYYTYGNYIPTKDYRSCFNSGMPEYTLYMNEFEYLWNQASPSAP